jgi:hypothetical protein
LRKFIRLFALSTIFISSLSFTVLADTVGTTTRTGALNTNFKRQVSVLDDDFKVKFQHSSMGFWRQLVPDYNVTGGEEPGYIYTDIKDGAIYQEYFPQVGTSGYGLKKATEQLKSSYTLPSDVQKFIKAYGTDSIGVKFEVGVDGTTIANNLIKYTISPTKIYVDFTPVLRYSNNNYIKKFPIWGSMVKQIELPRPASTYGENWLSVLSQGPTSPTDKVWLEYVRMNDAMMNLMYKATVKDYYSTSTPKQTTTLGTRWNKNSSGLYPTAYLNAGSESGRKDGDTSMQPFWTSTFLSGGGFSAHFYFPVKITFYTAAARQNSLSFTGYEYKDTAGKYWVKASNNFIVNSSGSVTDGGSIEIADDKVKIESLELEVFKGGVSQGKLNARAKAHLSSINNRWINTALSGIVNYDTTATVGSRYGTNSLNAGFVLNIPGDQDLEVRGQANLIDYPATSDTDYSGSNFYHGDTSSNYMISSDGTNPSGVFSPSSITWTKNNVTANFNPSDARSGVKQWRYRISNDGVFDTEVWSSYIVGDTTSSITLSTQGQWKIQAQITDNVGNVGTVTSGTYQIDKTLPSGAFTPNSSTWTKNNVSASFNPSDTGGSGVKQWRYRISGDGTFDTEVWSSYIAGDVASSITLSTQGQWKIQAEITDNALNIGTVISGTYQIDKTLPSGAFTPNSSTWTKNNVSASFDPSDTGGSGIKQWRYRTSSDGTFDTEAWSNYIVGDVASSITLSTQGQWKIQAEITDNALNIGTVTSGTYQIDKTLPSGVFTPNSATWTKNNVSASFDPSDTGGSGVSKWRYRTSTDNGTTWGAYSAYITGDTASSITLSTQGQWKIQAEVTDNAGNIGTVTSGTYQIDKTLPSGVFTPNNSTISIEKIDVDFDPSDTGGSGVKQWRYRTSIDNGTTWGVYSGYITGDTTTTITLNTPTNWALQAEVTDNAGNIRTVTSGTFIVIIPNPTINSLSVTRYDYKESNTSYWVKPNSTFAIYTDGYFPSSYGVFPTRNYVLFAKDGIYNDLTSARQYSTKSSKNKQGSEYDTNFNWSSSNLDLAQEYVLSGNNYLKTTHHLSAKLDNTRYKLYHTATYINNGTEYYDDYIDSGIWLNVDGIAPTGTAEFNYDEITAEMKVNVSDIVEEGSGVNKIWVEYAPSDNLSNIVTEELIKVDGAYQGGKNLYDIFSGNADTVNIKVKAIDNVGNERVISETNNDVFLIKASIERVLEPHVPIFKAGEKGILKIQLYGGVNKVQVTFPIELSTLDNTLNKEFIVEPKKYESINYEFYTPLNSESKTYNIEVKAFKQEREKKVYPSMEVSGSILQDLRTRIRIRR